MTLRLLVVLTIVGTIVRAVLERERLDVMRAETTKKLSDWAARSPNTYGSYWRARASEEHNGSA